MDSTTLAQYKQMRSFRHSMSLMKEKGLWPIKSRIRDKDKQYCYSHFPPGFKVIIIVFMVPCSWLSSCPRWLKIHLTICDIDIESCIILPPLWLIRDFGKWNARGNVSISLACYQQSGSKSTTHSLLAWHKEGLKVTLVVDFDPFCR